MESYHSIVVESTDFGAIFPGFHLLLVGDLDQFHLVTLCLGFHNSKNEGNNSILRILMLLYLKGLKQCLIYR